VSRLRALPEAAGLSAPDAQTGHGTVPGAWRGWGSPLARGLAGFLMSLSAVGRGWRMGGQTMSGTIVSLQPPALPVGAHPNELDLRRIRRALESRRRYRYVEPRVVGIAGGYRIESPCCSRNIDPAGGMIDIARLDEVAGSGHWLLHCRDHARQRWVVHGRVDSLREALAVLCDDPDRLFWP
jgi:hypothetical protein